MRRTAVAAGCGRSAMASLLPAGLGEQTTPAPSSATDCRNHAGISESSSCPSQAGKKKEAPGGRLSLDVSGLRCFGHPACPEKAKPGESRDEEEPCCRDRDRGRDLRHREIEGSAFACQAEDKAVDRRQVHISDEAAEGKQDVRADRFRQCEYTAGYGQAPKAVVDADTVIKGVVSRQVLKGEPEILGQVEATK